MCLHPIQIKNPNYRKLNENYYNRFKDCSNQYLYVPCGHCSECIAVKQMYYVQRIEMESLDNHLFFCTLTYSNENIPSLVVGDYDIKYADISHLQKMFKRLRHDNVFGRPFRYLAVSERGNKKGRPHFHIIFIIPKDKSDDYFSIMNLERLMFDVVLKYWSKNIGSDKKPVYVPLCEYHEKFKDGKLFRNYDLHYINASLTENGVSDPAFYVLKYMLKPSNKESRLQQALSLNLDEDTYNDVWNIVRSRLVKSQNFGLSRFSKDEPISESVLKHIKKGVRMTKGNEFPYPLYFNNNGQHFPLSRYYRSFPELFGELDATRIYYESNNPSLDSSVSIDLTSMEMAKRKTEQFNKRVSQVDLHSQDFDFLYE